MMQRLGLIRVAILAATILLAHELAPEHPHDLAAYADMMVSAACKERPNHHNCVTPTATLGATLTPTLTATTLPTVTLTSTVLPTMTMAPTSTTVLSTATPLPDMIEGVPICTDHDKTTWHPLVKRDSAGAITCTYGHEHHADPTALNDIFGPVGAWYGGAQTISYPWQTSNATTGALENDAKHNGYKWDTGRDLVDSCPPSTWQGCILAYRAEAHMMGSASDAVVRLHSFSEEVLVEMNGQRGIFRYGGWMDTGHLALDVNPDAMLCPVLPTDPPAYTCDTGSFREYGSANVPSPYTEKSVDIGAWYAAPFTPLLEAFGPIDYSDPNHQMFYGAVGHNNSRGRITNLAISSRYDSLASGRSADGTTVTFRGYTDRNRQIVQGCTSIGVDCFPISYEAVPFGEYERHDLSPLTDFDVLSPSTGKSLIRFPN